MYYTYTINFIWISELETGSMPSEFITEFETNLPHWLELNSSIQIILWYDTDASITNIIKANTKFITKNIRNLRSYRNYKKLFNYKFNVYFRCDLARFLIGYDCVSLDPRTIYFYVDIAVKPVNLHCEFDQQKKSLELFDVYSILFLRHYCEDHIDGGYFGFENSALVLKYNPDLMQSIKIDLLDIFYYFSKKSMMTMTHAHINSQSVYGYLHIFLIKYFIRLGIIQSNADDLVKELMCRPDRKFCHSTIASVRTNCNVFYANNKYTLFNFVTYTKKFYVDLGDIDHIVTHYKLAIEREKNFIISNIIDNTDINRLKQTIEIIKSKNDVDVLIKKINNYNENNIGQYDEIIYSLSDIKKYYRLIDSTITATYYDNYWIDGLPVPALKLRKRASRFG
jgi:hypothetical protein